MEHFQSTAAIFDLDHSTLDGNAGVLFTRFLYTKGALPSLYRRQIPGLIYRYAVGKASEAEMVEFGSRCQDGLGEEEVRALAADCFSQLVRPRITREGREALRGHLLRGHLVIVASGSPQPIVNETARFLGAHVAIGTRARVEEGRFRGEIETLSFQEGKRDLVLAALSRFGVEPARAALYSDSVADLPLFERVGRAVVVNPEADFARLAQERSWEIRQWKTRLGKPRPKSPDPIDALAEKAG
jgi:HAD superfamily hydrolase (TIGR01490 family)